nr:HD domain-containing phosphohydrolase [uncultured Desulfobulbus sp.]
MYPPQRQPLLARIGVGVLMGVLVLVSFFSVAKDSTHSPAKVSIGILAKRGSAIDVQLWSPTADYLTAQLPGYQFHIVPLDFGQIHEAVHDGRISFVLANSAMYVELEKLHGVNRIATLINGNMPNQETTTFGGVIFCRADRTDMQTLADLQDKRFMAVDARSFGGWIVCWRELQRHHIDPLRFFASFEYGNTQDTVVRRVLEGTVDAGTVRTDTLERMAESGLIGMHDVRILNEQQVEGFPFRLSTELYPEWPMAALKSTPGELTRQVASALLAMQRTDPAARAGNIAGWTAPLNYQPVHDCLLDLRIGPYTDFGQFTLQDVLRQYWQLISLMLAALIAILFTHFHIYRLNRKLRHKNSEIDKLNASLEARVDERTRQINTLLDRELYLLEIMETVAKINGLLISATSLENLLTEVCTVMGTHSHYGYCWIGLLDNELVHQIYTSDTSIRLPGQFPYDPANPSSPFARAAAAESILKNRTVTRVQGEQGRSISPWLDLANRQKFRAVISLALRPERKAKPLGVFSVYTMRPEGFEPEEIAMLEELAGDIGFAVQSFRQQERVSKLELERRENYEQTIRSFAEMIDQRDTYTAGHTLRVACYSEKIGKEFGLSGEQLTLLQQAAILHDIGKIATPDSVLLKPGILSSLDYDLIKLHAVTGHAMLAGIPMYKELAEIILHHHERFDGNGYPNRLQGDQIPLLARIITVADSFDAMTTNRIYKARKSLQESLDELQRLSGSQFDPEVVAVAVRVLKDARIPKDINQLPTNQMEQRRFSYFFSDRLTGFFNEDYLQIILRSDQMLSQFHCLHSLHLKNLPQYNKRHGWEQGNQLMQKFAAALQALYPDALLFRVYGYNFVIMAREHVEIREENLLFPCFDNTGVSVESSHIDLNDQVTYFLQKMEKLEILSHTGGVPD